MRMYYVYLLRYYWLWFIKINKLEHSFLFKYTCVFGNVRNRTGEQIRQSVFVHKQHIGGLFNNIIADYYVQEEPPQSFTFLY